jgi:capsular exopolysaccharide synthesis family protein
MSEDYPGNPQNLPARQEAAPPPSTDVRYYDEEIAESPEGGSGLMFRRYLAAVKRYRVLVFAGFAIGIAAGLFAWDTVVPLYQADARLWFEESSNEGIAPVRQDALLDRQSRIDLLRSFAVLQPVAVREKLYLNPETPGDSIYFKRFELAERVAFGDYRLDVLEDGSGAQLWLNDAIPVGTYARGDSIGKDVGLLWGVPWPALPAGTELRFRIDAPREAASRLRTDLGTRADRDVVFLQLSLTGPDPRRVASTINSVIEEYVQLATTLKRERLDELTKILQEQMDFAYDQLRQAEIALEDFRVQTITLPSDGFTGINPGLQATTNPVMNSYFNLQLEAEQTQQHRERLEEVLAEIPTTGVVVEAIEIIPSAARSTQLQDVLASLKLARNDLRTLRTRYTDEHPDVIEARKQIEILERDEVPVLLSILIDELKNEETVLRARLAETSADLREIPIRSIEESRLRREVASAERLFTQIQGRYETARLAAASTIPDVRVLDEARIPQNPLNDNRIQMAGVAFLGILGLSIAAAILLDQMDPRVRYPEQVTQGFGMRILGSVPRIPKGKVSDSDEQRAAVVEAFRELRLNLQYAYGSAGPIAVTFSSPGSSEGKSVVTANLAAAFAGLGRRTIIVDGDVRRGDIHELVKADRKPGLIDFLADRSDMETIIQKTRFGHLDFIGSGARESGGPEYLASRKVTELFSALRKRYEVILVDAPPLGAGGDAFLLSTLTGNLAMVFRAGESDRALAQAKLEPAQYLPIRVLGAVLNDLRPQGAYRYYSTYLPGYAAGDEAPSTNGGGGRKLMGPQGEPEEREEPPVATIRGD